MSEDLDSAKFTPVPALLWREVRDFFRALISQCRDCLRGNPLRCWHGSCEIFEYRSLARRVESVSLHSPVKTPEHIMVENEILDQLHAAGIPLYPSQIRLVTTTSKANKRNAINRLVRQGRIVEERINDYTRKISLPPTDGTNNNTDNN